MQGDKPGSERKGPRETADCGRPRTRPLLPYLHVHPRPKDSGSRCLWSASNALTAAAPMHSLRLQGLFSDVGVREGFLHNSTRHSRKSRGLIPRGKDGEFVSITSVVLTRSGSGREPGSTVGVWCHPQAPRSPPAVLAAAVPRATLSCPPSVLSRVPAPGTLDMARQGILPAGPTSPARTSNLTQISAPASPTRK